MFSFIAIIILVLLTAQCDKIQTVPVVELNQIKLEVPGTVETIPGALVSCDFKSGYGPSASDIVVLRPVVEAADVECAIQDLKESSFSFRLPKPFEYGKYKFCIRRGNSLRGYGNVEFVAPGTGGSDGPELNEGTTVYGYVMADGQALQHVSVSDGVEVVQTDENGFYQMASKKQNSYVFVSVPSGYEATNNGIIPQLYKTLANNARTPERVDFVLYPAGDQTNHTMLYFGDMHMAKRTNDRNQFATFTSEVAAYVNAHESDKVYAITLGDMTWDLYWYQNNYCFAQYLQDMKAVGNLSVFHTVGNHDHDMNATGDSDTILKFREDIGPNYYSFNIGKIHYVILDDIQCTNERPSITDGGVRQYKNKIVDEQLAWLKKDLAFVEKSSPVVVCLHAPIFNRDGGNSLENASAFLNLFTSYDLTIVSGHSHVIYNIDKGSVREHNNGAVCAAWWWAGKYYPSFNISTDGAPNGYRVTSVKGTEQESYFKAVGRSENCQFRAYDRNMININPAEMGMPSQQEEVLTQELKNYGSYNSPSAANEVIINVWDWDPDWKVEVTENGKSLTVSQFTGYDPGFFLAYSIPRMQKDKASSLSWHPSRTNHLFKVKASSADSTLEIKVTDDENRVYTETMTRPREFKIENYK